MVRPPLTLEKKANEPDSLLLKFCPSPACLLIPTIWERKKRSTGLILNEPEMVKHNFATFLWNLHCFLKYFSFTLSLVGERGSPDTWDDQVDFCLADQVEGGLHQGKLSPAHWSSCGWLGAAPSTAQLRQPAHSWALGKAHAASPWEPAPQHTASCCSALRHVRHLCKTTAKTHVHLTTARGGYSQMLTQITKSNQFSPIPRCPFQKEHPWQHTCQKDLQATQAGTQTFPDTARGACHSIS